jgi:hypothetical protein
LLPDVEVLILESLDLDARTEKEEANFVLSREGCRTEAERIPHRLW